MIYGYCHITPGRLRVKVLGIKDKPDAAKSLQILMHTIDGVKTVNANHVTSKVLVTFDPNLTTHENLLKGLSDLGYYPLLTEKTEAVKVERSSELLAELGLNIGKAIAMAALKQALKSTPAGVIIKYI